MRIASLQKQSFIDWPGKVVAVIFTKGCNFRCGFCHNPTLVLPELLNQTPDLPEADVLAYLNQRRNWLDGVVVTGGEPSIQKDLKHFLNSIKELGYPIKLDTNGSNPTLLKELIDSKLLDYVAMDIKTILEQDKYEEITKCTSSELIGNIKRCLRILRKSNVPYQLRTTIVPKFHTTEIKNILLEEFQSDNYIFQDFRQGETIDKLEMR